jgi:hypothetical protein
MMTADSISAHDAVDPLLDEPPPPPPHTHCLFDTTEPHVAGHDASSSAGAMLYYHLNVSPLLQVAATVCLVACVVLVLMKKISLKWAS